MLTSSQDVTLFIINLELKNTNLMVACEFGTL
jgi:hypothetical protein